MRPCSCERLDRSTSAEYHPGDCRLCWLYHNDEGYRAFFDGSPFTGRADRAANRPACVRLGRRVRVGGTVERRDVLV